MSEHLAHIRVTLAGPRFHLARHLVEMMVAMWVGMPLGRVIFAVVYGSGSDAAVHRHDVAWALLMAIAMAAPMVAVMLYRGHSARSACEMAAAMMAPALPLVALKVGHVISWRISGVYMAVSMVAMIALIVYRHSEYRKAAAAHA